MRELSTRQAAKLLGLSHAALVRYMAAGKIPVPKAIQFGKFKAHLWTEAEIEHVRQLLPKIANGRKTRYKKKQSAPGKQQSRQARGRSAKAKGKTSSKKKK
jgi:predicted DNA-binding transcriptional regulator AlpA